MLCFGYEIIHSSQKKKHQWKEPYHLHWFH